MPASLVIHVEFNHVRRWSSIFPNICRRPALIRDAYFPRETSLLQLRESPVRIQSNDSRSSPCDVSSPLDLRSASLRPPPRRLSEEFQRPLFPHRRSRSPSSSMHLDGLPPVQLRDLLVHGPHARAWFANSSAQVPMRPQLIAPTRRDSSGLDAATTNKADAGHYGAWRAGFSPLCRKRSWLCGPSLPAWDFLPLLAACFFMARLQG